MATRAPRLKPEVILHSDAARVNPFPAPTEHLTEGRVSNKMREKVQEMTTIAPNEVHVAFASNANGILPLKVAMWSVLESAAPETVCNIYVLSDGIPGDMQEQVRAMAGKAGGRHRITFIAVEDIIPENLKGASRLPRTSWARIFLPKLLPDVHRILYLDIDTLTCTDLRQLMEMDMKGAAIGAVIEYASHAGSDFNERLDIPQSCPGYFNAGVLLMDLDTFRREDFIPMLLDFAERYKDVLTGIDQDTLNGVLWSRTIHLHPRWNWHDGLTRRILKNKLSAPIWQGNSPLHSVEAALAPAILHFQGPHKPWHYNHLPERKRYEECMRRAGLEGAFPLPGFNLKDAIKRIVYIPIYMLTRHRIARLARRLHARVGDACGTAARP